MLIFRALACDSMSFGMLSSLNQLLKQESFRAPELFLLLSLGALAYHGYCRSVPLFGDSCAICLGSLGTLGARHPRLNTHEQSWNILYRVEDCFRVGTKAPHALHHVESGA